MDIKKLLDMSKNEDAVAKASLNFCLTVCSMLLAMKCEDVGEVTEIKNGIVSKMKDYQKLEVQQLEDLDPIQKMLLGVHGGQAIDEILKELHLQMLKATDTIFDVVVEMNKTYSEGKKNGKKNS